MNARHQRILEQVQRHGEVSVLTLATRFRVSPVTIRRDLATLETEGVLTRTHGGAVCSERALVSFVYGQRAQEHTDRKAAIARVVAAAIKPGMTLVLDTGTTTLQVARAITGIARLRVLTTSLAIASALHAHANIDLVLLGGSVRHQSPDLSGPLTEENLRQFRVDIAVVGADALDSSGLFTSDMGIARISSAMFASASSVWVAADSSKFSRRAFVKFADWSDVNHLVTDDALPARDRKWLAPRVTHLHLAPLS